MHFHKLCSQHHSVYFILQIQHAYQIALCSFMGCTVCFSTVCGVTVPSSSSGAIRLAANLNMTLIMFDDSSTASFTAFMGSEPILLRPPGGAGTWIHAHKHTGWFSLSLSRFPGQTSNFGKSFWILTYTFAQCRQSCNYSALRKCPTNMNSRAKG